MTTHTVSAYAAHAPGEAFQPYSFERGPLGDEEVDVDVEHCGLCHSDLSMWQNDWGITTYPFVPGHEIVGTVRAAGAHVKGIEVGQRVGIGWYARSCMACHQCMSGDQHLCHDTDQTIVGRQGGFADKVRCHWAWATPLPDDADASRLGPLFCGGITVFGPIDAFDVKPTDHVGVIGIGGLGHLAIQMLNKWGCHVTAFTSSAQKTQDAMLMGAHRVVDSRDPRAIRQLKGSLNFILNTTNVTLDWSSYLQALGPRGRFHTVGAVLDPMAIQIFELMGGQKSISSSPLGSPATARIMIDFCTRHGIYPQTEHFKLSQINDAFAHLASGQARYRVVIDMP